MSTTPDFIARADGSYINNAGREFLVRHAAMMKEKSLLDACEVGAAIAQIFVQNPWLQFFGVQISSTVDYDRGAAEHTNVCRIEVLEPVAVQGVALPPEMVSSGEFDELAAERLIHNALHDALPVMHETLLGLNQEASERFYFDRSKILGLAGPSGEIKGSSAFAALFADTSARLLIQPDWATPSSSPAQDPASAVARPRMR